VKQKFIPYGRQSISKEDIEAVIEVLNSEFLTQGPTVPRFEGAIAAYCNAEYAVSSNSATSSLHIACLALGLGPGDIFWTVPNTFVASANCGLYCGATVDFVDIDPSTYNMSISSLEQKLDTAKRNGRLPKLIIAVHFAGQSCSMREIYNLSQKYGFKIIEDASHAIGGSYLSSLVGSCKYSDITIFSFHPVKIITTGEGGIALTNNAKLNEKLRLFRSHGITRDRNLMTAVQEGSWSYEQIELGYNYRMTDFQAALGLSQIERLGIFIKERHRVARWYGENLLFSKVILPWQDPDAYSSYHLYPILINEGDEGPSRNEIFEKLKLNNIGVNVHYMPVHLQPYFRRMGFKEGDFPVAEAYAKKAISLPIFPGLMNSDLCHIRDCLKKALNL
jgi:UDP-4-amino-4,6-dideoxy-N-acetyl-beta-L-altrosamine transaminase